METGYLNFHDAEHFTDFELPLDQHDLLDDSENSLMAICDTDFDYIESMDTSGALWGTEQELNGDMAVLPDSGVASVIPRMENIKEDFAKVLSDWQEHIGYMQASDFEEDIDMSALNIHMPEKLHTDLPDDIFQNEFTHFSPEKNSHLTITSPPKKIFPSLPLIDSKPTLINLSILPDEILQSKSPVKTISTSMRNVISPVKLKVKTHSLQQVDSNIRTDVKMDIEDCIDIETISEHEPVLEAGDVKSLLEQFEASEVGMSQPIVNTGTKLAIKKNVSKKSRNKCRVHQSKQTLSKRLIQSKESKLHQNIRDSLPKEVIDRIKASGRKNVISVISAMSAPTKLNRTDRLNDITKSNSENKTSGIARTHINFSNRIDGSVQLDHDYCGSAKSAAKSDRDETCIGRKKPTINNNHKNSITQLDEQMREATMHKRNATFSEIWVDSNSKKDSGLESGDVSDASEEPTLFSSASKNPSISIKTNHSRAQMHPKPMNTSNVIIENDITNAKAPLYEMKIRSALATSILQLRDGVLSKAKSIDNSSGIHKPIQMVSVLKKPPVNSSIITKNHANESIVTTINSSNDEVQNIIVQEISAAMMIEEGKKPVRRKLNLAEYRSRRDQGKSDNSRTCSPIQPMILIYIHHASTTTEPIKDDPTNPIWSEREIVSVLKPKTDIEEDKYCAKPLTCEISTQTDDSAFDTAEKKTLVTTTSTSATTTSIITAATVAGVVAVAAPIVDEIEVSEKEESRVSRLHDRKQRNYRQQLRSSSSSNRSRSRSRSQSRSCRSRSRSTNNSRSRSRRRQSIRSRSRSLSRRRSRRTRRSRSRSSSSRSASRSRSISRQRNARRRRISHRRSSVSSSSSWSSRSRSRSPYRSRSQSTYRSRSQSTSSSYSRSRSSRSRSSSRYSSCSRSSSRSNLARNKSSLHQRRLRHECQTRYGRRSRGSSRSNCGYYGQRRSSGYRRPHDVWCHQEKKRQVEERRVIYVGRLEETITKADLRRRFEAFGPVLDISLHFREHGDNYGFVTFAYKNDAYEAVEHGNDDPSLSRYDLCFGGRRAFCKVKYADLDGMASNSLGGTRNLLKADEDNNTFDLLLKQAKAKLRNRKIRHNEEVNDFTDAPYHNILVHPNPPISGQNDSIEGGMNILQPKLYNGKMIIFILRKLEDSRCPVCYAHIVNVVCLPCWHRYLCESCTQHCVHLATEGHGHVLCRICFSISQALQLIEVI